MFVVKVLARLLTNMNLEFLLVDKRTRTFFYVGETVILDRYQKEFLCKQRDSLWYPSTLRYLQQSLTWHGVSSQVSHTLKRLTPTAPHKLILPSSQRYRPRSWHNTAQRAICPKLKPTENHTSVLVSLLTSKNIMKVLVRLQTNWYLKVHVHSESSCSFVD